MISLLYTPCSSETEAKSIAGQLVKSDLIACANIFPIQSVYKWEGEIEEGNEYVLLCKVLNEKVEEAKKEIEKLHSYDVPCVLELQGEVNEKYFWWMQK